MSGVLKTVSQTKYSDYVVRPSHNFKCPFQPSFGSFNFTCFAPAKLPEINFDEQKEEKRENKIEQKRPIIKLTENRIEISNLTSEPEKKEAKKETVSHEKPTKLSAKKTKVPVADVDKRATRSMKKKIEIEEPKLLESKRKRK